MGTLNSINPMAAALYFLMTAGIAMFSMNPVILTLSLIGGVIFFFIRQKNTRTTHNRY